MCGEEIARQREGQNTVLVDLRPYGDQCLETFREETWLKLTRALLSDPRYYGQVFYYHFVRSSDGDLDKAREAHRNYGAKAIIFGEDDIAMDSMKEEGIPFIHSSRGVRDLEARFPFEENSPSQD